MGVTVDVYCCTIEVFEVAYSMCLLNVCQIRFMANKYGIWGTLPAVQNLNNIFMVYDNLLSCDVEQSTFKYVPYNNSGKK